MLKDGTEGSAGQLGERGQIGLCGPEGPFGPVGRNGADGAQGPQGPRGKQGKEGPAGKVKVTCRLKQKGKKVKVTCAVKNQKSHKRHYQRRRLGWRLMRGGHAVSHGKTSVRRLERVLNHAHAGHYVLYLEGQGAQKIVVR